jgi:glutathione S-transferase
MAGNFILYGSPHSQFTYKIALTLRLACQAFSFRYISFQKGMQILEHIAETLGRFGGAEPSARQRIREFLYWDADRFAPPIYGCYGVALGERGLLPIKVDPVIAAYHRKGVEAAFAALDVQLGERDFLAAPELTIADLCCYGETAFARMSSFDLAPWPKVERWAKAIEGRPGFRPPLELLPMADAEIAWV